MSKTFSSGDASLSTILERRSSSSASRSRPNEVAYIQYTSGSTSIPRGVEVTPGGLVHNLHCIVDALAIGPEDVCVTWLPHFHDMGLVGTLLAPLFVGASTIVLSPLDFVRAPIKWLQAFTDFRGTFTASPNFGYALCASRARIMERRDSILRAGARPRTAPSRFAPTPCGDLSMLFHRLALLHRRWPRATAWPKRLWSCP